MFPSLTNFLQTSGSAARENDVLRVLEAGISGFPGLAAPVPTVAAIGTNPGSTTYSYTVTAIGPFGAISTVSATVSTKNNPQLSGTAYNRINWGPVPDAVGYTISRTAGGGGQGIVAVVAAGNTQACESMPAGALVPPAFPLMPSFELHDIGLAVLNVP